MNADTLLSQVKSHGALPSINSLSDSIIVDHMNSELKSMVALFIEATREEFFTDSQDFPLINGTTGYTVPERAMASTARVVKYVDSSGAEDPQPLRQYGLGDVGDFAFLSGNPIGFYLLATDVCPLPHPGSGSTGSLRMYYARRPSDLVLDALNGSSQHTAVGTIASITKASGNSTINLAAAHSGFPAGGTIDIQSAKSPYKLLAKDVTVTTAVAGTTIVCNAVDLTTIGAVAGDYVTLAKTGYIPLLPQEAHDMLRDFTIARCLTTLNLTGRAAALRGEATDRARAFLKIAEPRVNQNPKAISSWRGWRSRSAK